MTLEESEQFSSLKLSVEDLTEQLEWLAKEHWEQISAPDQLGISNAIKRAEMALGEEGVWE